MGPLLAKILIAGSPHSGTNYVQQVLSKLISGVGHEDVYKPTGNKTWFPKFSIEVTGHWAGTTKGDFELIHLVREPLKQVITSYRLYSNIHDLGNRVYLKGLTEITAESLAKRYVDWNKRISKIATNQLRVEKDIVPEVICSLGAKVGHSVGYDEALEAINSTSKTTNSTRHMFTGPDVIQIDNPEFWELTEEYGYPCPR